MRNLEVHVIVKGVRVRLAEPVQRLRAGSCLFHVETVPSRIRQQRVGVEPVPEDRHAGQPVVRETRLECALLHVDKPAHRIGAGQRERAAADDRQAAGRGQRRHILRHGRLHAARVDRAAARPERHPPRAGERVVRGRRVQRRPQEFQRAAVERQAGPVGRVRSVGAGHRQRQRAAVHRDLGQPRVAVAHPRPGTRSLKPPAVDRDMHRPFAE